MKSSFLRISLLVLVGGALSAVFVGCGSSNKLRLPEAANDPNVVAVFGSDVLTLDEFEQRYTRSEGTRELAQDDSLAEYQEFLERYVDFRLKVMAAREAGIHESPEILQEIETYRTNLARPYLLEAEVIEPVIRQLYDRRQEMVDASHILLRVSPGASPEDTLAAFNRMVVIRDSALQGIDFAELAFRHSEDPSARGRATARGYQGRLGYFTAGALVEPFETFAYETAPGEISPIFRTQFGYHILTVHDRITTEPDIRLSHIMIRPNPTPEDSARALEEVRDLKRRLDAGADFAALAREHSVDRQSAERGGDLGMVSMSSPLPPTFQEAAFDLEKVGDVSEIVETPFGYHLIKLTGREEKKTYDEAYEELKQLASRLPRTQTAERAFARSVIREMGVTVDTSAVLDAFEGIPADSVFTRLVAKKLPNSALANAIFALGDSVYTVADMADHVKQVPSHLRGNKPAQAREFIEQFVTEVIVEHESDRLEQRDPEFRRLMNEFRDGLVLFKFMEDSVWTAADRDSSALVAYYEAHAEEYRWPDRTRIVSLQSRSDSLLQTLSDRLKAGATVADVYAQFESDTLNTLVIDTMLVADSTGTIYDQALGLKKGEFTGVLPHRGTNMILVHDGVEPARGKTFEEARTEVVSRYQSVLEDRLISRLRRRYNAHTFPQRLANAYRNAPQQALTSDG